MNENQQKQLEQTIDEATKIQVLSGENYTHKFKTPFDYNGQKYSELTFDFGKLTGKDGIEIEDEIMQQKMKHVIAPAFSAEYLVRLAAKACTSPIGADAFDQMKLSDFSKIRGQAKDFLLKSE